MVTVTARVDTTSATGTCYRCVYGQLGRRVISIDIVDNQLYDEYLYLAFQQLLCSCVHLWQMESEVFAETGCSAEECCVVPGVGY